jgi:hypothetical protein
MTSCAWRCAKYVASERNLFRVSLLDDPDYTTWTPCTGVGEIKPLYSGKPETYRMKYRACHHTLAGFTSKPLAEKQQAISDTQYSMRSGVNTSSRQDSDIAIKIITQ